MEINSFRKMKQDNPVYFWYPLDPDVGGGYMAAHVGEGNDFQVFTTPISKKTKEEHQIELEEKIRNYGKHSSPRTG